MADFPDIDLLELAVQKVDLDKNTVDSVKPIVRKDVLAAAMNCLRTASGEDL